MLTKGMPARVIDCSVAFVTDAIDEARKFYDTYFDTWYPFDCGWYVLLRLGRHDGVRAALRHLARSSQNEGDLPVASVIRR